MRAVVLSISSVQSRIQLAILVFATMLTVAGCNAKSFFDPSKTGAFRSTPTTIPVLERLDVIEPADTSWSQASAPTSDDLLPIDLEYRLVPGDVVTVSVFELNRPQQETVVTRRVEADGTYRVPSLDAIPAAGLTIQEFQDKIWQIVNDKVVVDPQVNVVLEEGGAFTYTVSGAISGPGLYTLRRGDFRLFDAMAVAGGLPTAVKYVYVIRQVSLSERMQPRYDQGTGQNGTPPSNSVDVDDLIDQLNDGKSSPGAFASGDPMIDVDDLEPIRQNGEPLVDVDKLAPPDGSMENAEGDSFIYVPERNEWVRVKGDGKAAAGNGATDENGSPMVLERVIRISADQLRHGDSSVNVVIRPYDKIYVEAPSLGVIYIGGEISRPGVYNMPSNGDSITLSRFITSAGGLSPLAIPERVDLTRQVGHNLEATITVDLAAIMNRTAPDIIMKPNDHVIIGTSWFATPLAIFRNGFRMTYGFGFLLDRNFGNDVFGAPPSSNGFNN